MFSPTSESDIEIDFKELLIGEKIGSGSFGEVHQGYWHGKYTNVLFEGTFNSDPSHDVHD